MTSFVSFRVFVPPGPSFIKQKRNLRQFSHAFIQVLALIKWVFVFTGLSLSSRLLRFTIQTIAFVSHVLVIKG